MCVDYSFPLQFCAFEIEDKADGEACDLQIVDHLSDFMICDLPDGFRIDDDLLEGNQIGNIFSDYSSFIDNVESGLLQARYAPETKLHRQRIFRKIFPANRARAYSAPPSPPRE